MAGTTALRIVFASSVRKSLGSILALDTRRCALTDFVSVSRVCEGLWFEAGARSDRLLAFEFPLDSTADFSPCAAPLDAAFFEEEAALGVAFFTRRAVGFTADFFGETFAWADEDFAFFDFTDLAFAFFFLFFGAVIESSSRNVHCLNNPALDAPVPLSRFYDGMEKPMSWAL